MGEVFFWNQNSNQETIQFSALAVWPHHVLLLFFRLIQFRDAGSSTGNTSQELYLAANSTLTMLMLQGDPIPLLQYAVALTQMLNSASTGSLQSNDLELQAMVRTAITVCVSSTVPVETLQQVQQMAYLLSLLTVSCCCLLCSINPLWEVCDTSLG